MRQILTFVRRLVLGIMLGQAFLVLGVLDIVRARVMAQATGIFNLREIAPVAQIIFFLSSPIGIGMENRGQDPIALLVLLVTYWALVGVLVFYLFLGVKRLYGSTRKSAREENSTNRNNPAC